MPLGHSILKPFIEPRSKPWHARFWLILILGAPFALAAGVWMQYLNNARGERTISVDRAKVISIARQVATTHGYDASHWSPYVRFEHNDTSARFFQANPARPQSRSRLSAPDSVITTLLVQPGDRVWCRVKMGPGGFVTGVQFGGRGFGRDFTAGPEDNDRKAAEASLREWLGDMALERLGEPEVSTTQEAGIPGARRYVWRAQPRRFRELELIYTFDVVGGRLIHREVEPTYAESFVARVLTPSNSVNQLAGTFRSVLIVFLAIYAAYRFARRALEREVPHARAFLLGSSVVLFGVLQVAVDPYAHSGDLRLDHIQGPYFLFQLLLVAAVIATQALLIGIAYGAGEGEVREAWPGKLTSLDTLLTGHLFSANAGVSAVAGVALGFWLFPLTQLLLSFFPVEANAGLGSSITRSFGPMPLPVLLLNAPVVAVFNTVLSLLVPLIFLRRHFRSGKVQLGLLILIAFLMGPINRPPDFMNGAYWIDALAITLAIIVPFFAADYLACVASLVTLNFLEQFLGLAAIMPFWASQIPLISAVAAAIVLPIACAAWLGRRYGEAEVRPMYAVNLMERLSLQAEIGAARQAQLRLLPEHPPHVPGVTIAASCTPAGEVGGDFYDFFPLPSGALGIIVAEGGNDGLASALTIALAKGFLRYEAAYQDDVEQVLLRLEKALGSNLTRTSGRTSLALFLMDPLRGTLRMARIGDYPRVLVLSADHAVSEFLPRPHVAGLPVETEELSLMPGDSIFIYTDGLPRLLEGHPSGTPGDLLAYASRLHHIDSAERLHSAVLELLLEPGSGPGSHLTDDLTAVTLRFEAVQSIGEAVA